MDLHRLLRNENSDFAVHIFREFPLLSRIYRRSLSSPGLSKFEKHERSNLNENLK